MFLFKTFENLIGCECVYTQVLVSTHLQLFPHMVAVSSESIGLRSLFSSFLLGFFKYGSATYELYDLNDSSNQFLVENLTHKNMHHKFAVKV